jgi:hypothetical protein
LPGGQLTLCKSAILPIYHLKRVQTLTQIGLSLATIGQAQKAAGARIWSHIVQHESVPENAWVPDFVQGRVASHQGVGKGPKKEQSRSYSGALLL